MGKGDWEQREMKIEIASTPLWKARISKHEFRNKGEFRSTNDQNDIGLNGFEPWYFPL
jgi:hypothetical protein